MASEGRACASCQSACFSAGYDCDPSDACDYSCEDIAPCGDWESECTLEGFEVALPNNPSEEIERACAQLDAHLGACGFGDEISSDDCRRFAVTERPEMAAQYECVATLSCEELTDPDAAARCAVPPSTFGDTLCARMGGICPEGGCNSGTAESLNHVGAFLREDAKDAAMRCAGQDTCDEAVDCFEAWADAVL